MDVPYRGAARDTRFERSVFVEFVNNFVIRSAGIVAGNLAQRAGAMGKASYSAFGDSVRRRNSLAVRCSGDK